MELKVDYESVSGVLPGRGIHSMELKDLNNNGCAFMSSLHMNPFNGIESRHRGIALFSTSSGHESIQWN